MSKITPSWLSHLLHKGYVPYIATSKRLLPHFNLRPFGVALTPFLLEEAKSQPFLEAYLLSDSLSFKDASYKMPAWVYVDCVLLQHAVVGFMKPKESVPSSFLDFYKNDPCVNVEGLTHIPISGQIDAQTLDKSLVNFSLFSLGREIDGFKNLGLYTKLLSLEANNAVGRDYRIVAQYDSPSIKVHGKISSSLEIEQPMVPLHPGKDMTFVLKTGVDFDAAHASPQKPSFWMKADDLKIKQSMQDGIENGNKYIIPPPYSVTRKGKTLLPIIVQPKKLSL